MEHASAERDPVILLLGLRDPADPGRRVGGEVWRHGPRQHLHRSQRCCVAADPNWLLLCKLFLRLQMIFSA